MRGGSRVKAQGNPKELESRSQELNFELRIANLGFFSMLYAPCPMLEPLRLGPYTCCLTPARPLRWPWSQHSLPQTYFPGLGSSCSWA